MRIVQLDEETHQFVDNGGFEHPYPTTKIMWMPDQTGNRRDLLATTGDYLRLWNVSEKSVRLEALLNNVRDARAHTRPPRAPARRVHTRARARPRARADDDADDDDGRRRARARAAE